MIKDALNIIIADENNITIDMDKRIRKLLCDCFPKDKVVFSKTRYWNNVVPKWSVIIQENQTIIAHNAIIDRNVKIGDRFFKAIGIGNVCVAPQYQGKGLAKILMKKSIEHALKHNYDLGLLFCKQQIKDVYKKTGWQIVEACDILTVDSNAKQESWLKKNKGAVLMCYPLKTHVASNEIINLNGIDW